MRIRDCFLNQEASFKTRLLYAKFTNSYDCDAEAKFGYLDGAKECLEGYRPVEELEEYINEYEHSIGALDEYDKAYVLAYRDFIKQELKESVTNE